MISRVTLLRTLGKCIRILSKLDTTKSIPTAKQETDIRIVMFCGTKGIDYLNASLESIRKHWSKKPHITIVTDGSAPDVLFSKLKRANRNIEIIRWQTCADYFKINGNIQLYNYADRDVWGKKLVSILYFARKGRILYSDSDVIWFKDPVNWLDNKGNNELFIYMCPDQSHCYSLQMLSSLNNKGLLTNPPMNAGLMFLKGDFTQYHKWGLLCNYLEQHADYRSEQTTFAILSNEYGGVFNENEIMLELDDMFDLRPKQFSSKYSTSFARHYVNTKPWLFWRDYLRFVSLWH